MPAQGFPSSFWPRLKIFITHVANVPKLALKIYTEKGKTWWVGTGTLTHSHISFVLQENMWQIAKTDIYPD